MAKLKFERYFTKEDLGYKTTNRDIRIIKANGEVVFEQLNVETPAHWSDTAVRIFASKYFNGKLGTPERETSILDAIRRVVSTIARWGVFDGYFDDATGKIFEEELFHLMFYQYGCFNSPVLFNVGTSKSQQGSACQPYDALISTPKGFKKIGDLVTNNCIGEDILYKDGVTKIINLCENGIKEVFEILLSDGSSIKATGDHLLDISLSRKSKKSIFKKVSDITTNDYLILCLDGERSVCAFEDIKINNIFYNEAALAGWLLTDGYVGKPVSSTSTIVEFETINDAERSWVTEHLDKVFPSIKWNIISAETIDDKVDFVRFRSYGKKFDSFISKWELLNRKTDKKVPNILFDADLEAVICFLRSVFQADGYISIKKSSTGAVIGLSSISKRFILEIQLLLRRLGIYSNILVKKDERKNRHTSYNLTISMLSERIKFNSIIGFIGKDKSFKLGESLSLIGNKCPNRKHLKVKAIRSLGYQKVYDIQTESSTYLTNGISVHNCFINSVDDSMDSITDLVKLEAKIFSRGSGSGVNLSKLRAKDEGLSDGGTSSGPVSFMKGYDAFAGIIKSAGKTRRAACVRTLDVDHPDIIEFIQCKPKEEQKIRDLVSLGYSSGIDGEAVNSVAYQNANHCVRVSDAFMEACVNDEEWNLIGRVDESISATVKAKDILYEIAKSAHVCGDPGLMFADTVNEMFPFSFDEVYSGNPCFAGETLLVTDKGLYRIDTLADKKETFNILTKDGTFRKSTAFKSGVKDIYKVCLYSGHELYVTKDHKLLSNLNKNIFVEAGEVGATVYVSRSASKLPSLDIEKEPFYNILGYATGDGTPKRLQKGITEATHNARIYLRKDGDDSAIENLFKKCFPDYRYPKDEIADMISSKQFTIFWDSFSPAERVYDRIIPVEILSDVCKLRAFLRGIYSANGCVHEKYNRVSLKTTSKILSRQILSSLSIFGIVGYITTNKKRIQEFRNGKYEMRESYDLNISGAALDTFREEVGFLQKSKNDKLNCILHNRKKSFNRLTQIKSVEYVRTDLVYDFTEPVTHTGVANGVVVHNCFEFLFKNNSACNLASLNLVKFLELSDYDNMDDLSWKALQKAIHLFITAQDIIVDRASYPNEKIAETTKKYRPLGLGLTNVGAFLMEQGFPYGSAVALELMSQTADFLTRNAYYQSTKLAEVLGCSDSNKIDYVLEEHRNRFLEFNGRLYFHSWNEIIERFKLYGIRNLQTTLMAPTGTIAMIMDANSTGIEPLFSLVNTKSLVGGGEIKVVNPSIEKGLESLGYAEDFISRVIDGITNGESISDIIPEDDKKDLAVFACALPSQEGDPCLSVDDHLNMLQAIQPFISGGISKTINVPSTYTVNDIYNLFIGAWKRKLKSVIIYRDGSKAVQPLNTSKKSKNQDTPLMTKENPQRLRLPDERTAINHKFKISGYTGYLTVGLYENGSPGELFIKMSKAGSVVSGLVDSVALVTSMALQYGVPLKVLVDKFAHTRFEPSGFTGNPDIPVAKSVMDYVFRWLGNKFIDVDDSSMGVEDPIFSDTQFDNKSTGDISQVCLECGEIMRKQGTCFYCFECGASSGCS